MPNPLNNELLSAYLDNEVTEEERAQVKQALADSAETRTALESLKQVQARLRSVPRLTLPDNFHERVLREAEQRAARVATKPAGAARWLRYAAIGATVAAVLVIAVMIARKPDESEMAESRPSETDIVQAPVQQDPVQQDIVQQDIVQQDPPSEQPNPDLVEDPAPEDPSMPGDDVIVKGPKRPTPKLILVLDLAITKQAQNAKVFEKTLGNAGIVFDPRQEGVVLDPQLRKNLLKTRFVAGVDQPDAGKANERFDIIEMVYVQGTGNQFDEIEGNLRKDAQVHVVMDLAILPESKRVFNSIGERSWSLAKSETTGVPGSYAYRLNVGIRLYSSRTGFFAKFPRPGIDIRVLGPEDRGTSSLGLDFPLPLDLGGAQPKQNNANPAGAEEEEDPIYEVLIIRRDLKAGFPKNAQKPDPK